MWWTLNNFYESLVDLNDDISGLRPVLATAWQVAPSGKIYTLTLRSGVKFNDGTRVRRRRGQALGGAGAGAEEGRLAVRQADRQGGDALADHGGVPPGQAQQRLPGRPALPAHRQPQGRARQRQGRRQRGGLAARPHRRHRAVHAREVGAQHHPRRPEEPGLLARVAGGQVHHAEPPAHLRAGDAAAHDREGRAGHRGERHQGLPSRAQAQCRPHRVREGRHHADGDLPQHAGRPHEGPPGAAGAASPLESGGVQRHHGPHRQRRPPVPAAARARLEDGEPVPVQPGAGQAAPRRGRLSERRASSSGTSRRRATSTSARCSRSSRRSSPS